LIPILFTIGNWSLAPGPRGDAFDISYANRIGTPHLGHTFPTIDALKYRVARSFKSMDLDYASYATKNGILNKVVEYIDELDNFEGGQFGNIQVTIDDFNAKQLDFIVKRMLGILEAVNYANSKNINLNLVIAK